MQVKPGRQTVITIVSRSIEIRQWARAMLIAVGLEPESLCEIDAGEEHWPDRIERGAFVVTDAAVARELPSGCLTRVFRVVADSSVDELKQLCGCDTRAE